MDAKTLVDQMKAGMSEADRIKLADGLADVLQNHTRDGEGEIRHFLLLALGRVWQRHPAQPPMDSDGRRRVAAEGARRAVVATPTTRTSPRARPRCWRRCTSPAIPKAARRSRCWWRSCRTRTRTSTCASPPRRRWARWRRRTTRT